MKCVFALRQAGVGNAVQSLRGTPGTVHFFQLVLNEKVSGKGGIDREADSYRIVFIGDMNSFVEVHETCILFFSGMNKFQIRGGKFYGLPFAAMRVMEDKTCIQANE